MFGLQHASAIEFALLAIALAIMCMVAWGWLTSRRDLRNVEHAIFYGHADLISPRASRETTLANYRRQRFDLLQALVFVGLTIYALRVGPPPPGTFWGLEQITLAKWLILIGMGIPGTSSVSARRARRRIVDAIHADDRDRRLGVAAATRLGSEGSG